MGNRPVKRNKVEDSTRHDCDPSSVTSFMVLRSFLHSQLCPVHYKHAYSKYIEKFTSKN